MRTLDIAPIYEKTSSQKRSGIKRSGIERVVKGSQVCLPSMRLSSTNGMNILASQPKFVLICRPRRDEKLSWPTDNNGE